MNDISEFNSVEFGKYLLDANFITEGKEKYFVHWVRNFFGWRAQWPNISWSEQLPLFLQEMQNRPGYQDWQIRQADQAVRLYFNVFLKKIGTAEGDKSFRSQHVSGGKEDLTHFSESLRLRNYALRTEKTYLHWAERYFRYCKTRSTPTSEFSLSSPDSVRNFLTDLAVRKNVAASTQNLAFNSLLMLFRLVYNIQGKEKRGAAEDSAAPHWKCSLFQGGSQYPVYDQDTLRRPSPMFSR